MSNISKVQIYNIALNTLGVSTPLENVNLNDNKVILLNNYYNLARDYVLKDFDWNFASAYKELSLTNIPDSYSQYKYVYNYPNDCICARDIFEKGSYKLEKFSISSDVNGDRVILCNLEHPVLRYTRKVEKEIFYSCEFSMALAYYLASLTSNVLVGSIQKGELAYEKYKQILKRAKLLNAKEGSDFIYEDDTYLDSRI